MDFAGHIYGASAIAMDADGMCVELDRITINDQHQAGFKEGDEPLRGLSWVMDHCAVLIALDQLTRG